MSMLRDIGEFIRERQNGIFSLGQVMRATGCSRKNCLGVLFTLSSEKIVKQIRKQRIMQPGVPTYSMHYRVTDRAALAARIAPRMKENTIQDRMWFIMRKKRVFTLTDLLVLAGVGKGMARWYLKALRRAGVIDKSRSGGGPGVEWRIVKDPGPRRPYIKNRKDRAAV